MESRQTVAMHPSGLFNPVPRIERVALSNGGFCYVMDDVLCDPQGFATWAAESRALMRPVDFNAYPGTYLLVPESVSESLQEFFIRHIRGLFDARRLLHMHCRLAMVTMPPGTLRPSQWFCHADSFGLAPAQSIQASVLYLFRDEALGGTSFYEPTRPRVVIQQLFADSNTLRPEVFLSRYGIQPGYMHASNDYFRLIGTVPARWNRMVFYDGGMLHSGHITAPEKLTDDPATGRLTFNGFFTCRRRST